MPKVTLDMNTFKALASDTRLDILKALDGKKMSLKDISKATNLNKATLHEHLTKLNEAGLVKRKEREGHKWVYYKLTWKGEGLLHPENTRIVVMFTATFVALSVGILQFVSYVKGQIVAKIVTIGDSTIIYKAVETKNSLFGSSEVEYSQAPITIPSGEGASHLSQSVIDSIGVQDALGNVAHRSDVILQNVDPSSSICVPKIDVSSEYFSNGDTLMRGGLEDNALSFSKDTSSSSTTMVAIYQDKTFQIIAIVCIVLFVILLSFSIWRYWKNRKTKI